MRYSVLLFFIAYSFANAQVILKPDMESISKTVSALDKQKFDEKRLAESEGYKTKDLIFFTLKDSLIKVTGTVTGIGEAVIYYHLAPFRGAMHVKLNPGKEGKGEPEVMYFDWERMIRWTKGVKDALENTPDYYSREQLMMCLTRDIYNRWRTLKEEEKLPGHSLLAGQLKSITESLSKGIVAEKVEGQDAQVQLEQKGSYEVIKRRYGKGDTLLVYFHTVGTKNGNESETHYYYKGQLIVKFMITNKWSLTTIPNSAIQGTEDKQTSVTCFYKNGVLFRTETDEKIMRNYMDEYPSFMFRHSILVRNY